MAQKAAPEFNGKNGAVIDANKISGVFKSAIVVEDKILDDAEMSVNVYAWYAEDWLPLGTASLNQFDATAKIASQKEIKIADLRYFAVESEDRVLAFKARKFKKDLVIEVRDATSDLSKPVVPAFEQRDFYDLVWYLSRKTKPNLPHLQKRLEQSGKWDSSDTLTLPILKEMLSERFKEIDFAEAKKDVRPFIQDERKLDLWSAEFFTAIAGGM